MCTAPLLAEAAADALELNFYHLATDPDQDGAAVEKRLLDMVGDVNCWATSTRGLARCETALGDARSSAGRLLSVLDRMPTMPMPEITKPRTLEGLRRLDVFGSDCSTYRTGPFIPIRWMRTVEATHIHRRPTLTSCGSTGCSSPRSHGRAPERVREHAATR